MSRRRIMKAREVYAMIQAGKRTGFDVYAIAHNFTWAEVFGSMRGEEWLEVTLDMLEHAERMAWYLQGLRDRWGPLRITSWLRPPTYNARVSNATDSRHIVGDAVDFVPLTSSMKLVFDQLMSSGLKGGIAMDPGVFIHVDLRGFRATWPYRKPRKP